MSIPELYFEVSHTYRFVDIGKILQGKGYHKDSIYDDLLGITDFTDLPEKNPIHDYVGYDDYVGIVKSSKYLLTHPSTLSNTPTHFEYCGFQDILEQHDIILPKAESPFIDCSNAPVVHKKFIQVLLEHGFTDFRTYPVRVYYINTFNDIYSSDKTRKRYRFDTHDRTPRVSSEEAVSLFSFTDDLYVMFQLTNPEVQLFDEEYRQNTIHEKAGTFWTTRDLALRTDISTIELPLLFRFQHEIGLFCNPKFKQILEQFNTLSLSGGSNVHRKNKGNPIPFPNE